LTLANLLPDGIGQRRIPAVEGAAGAGGVDEADLRDLGGIRHRQRPEAHGVDHLEDRRVRADAERE
jgi:hypothetical protein